MRAVRRTLGPVRRSASRTPNGARHRPCSILEAGTARGSANPCVLSFQFRWVESSSPSALNTSEYGRKDQQLDGQLRNSERSGLNTAGPTGQFAHFGDSHNLRARTEDSRAHARLLVQPKRKRALYDLAAAYAEFHPLAR